MGPITNLVDIIILESCGGPLAIWKLMVIIQSQVSVLLIVIQSQVSAITYRYKHACLNMSPCSFFNYFNITKRQVRRT